MSILQKLGIQRLGMQRLGETRRARHARTSMRRRPGCKAAGAFSLAAAAALTLSACTSEAATLDVAPQAAQATASMIIDVRTPEEFAQGHLDGAVNIPVELPSFTAQIQALDPDASYLVYCRSGRRADVAIDYMQSLGMEASNLGSLEAAARATGVPVVR